jgi:flagellar basal body-associated protein FliL
MSETKEKEKPAQAGGSGPRLLGMMLPAVFAAAAAFGGAKVAGGHPASATPAAEHVEHEAKPPGPTLALEPFLLTVVDANKKSHPMKVTIAIEFDASEKEEALKALTPRIRDASLGYLRTLSHEEVIDPAGGDKLRSEMLEHLRASGATSAQHVLITDLVVQ